MSDKFDVLILMGSYGPDVPFQYYSEDSIWGKLTYYYYRKNYGIPHELLWFWWWDVLDAHYKMGDPVLKKIYNEIRELTVGHKILLHAQGDMMHPNFIKTLSKKFNGPIYTIYSIDGEPGSSKVLSHPVVHAYDFATTCGSFFDEGVTTCAEKLIECGVPGAAWVACGTKYHKGEDVWEYPIDSGRDIDIIFLGPPRYDGDEERKYPPFDFNVMAMPKYTVCKYLKDHGINIHYEPWQNEKQASELYKRAKMGLNVHGPSAYGIGSSQRTWDLAACGIMPVTDGKGLGIEKIFTPGEECAAFSYRDLDEAVSLIKHYLENDTERIRIANNARARTFREYRNDADDSYLTRIIRKALDYWKSTGKWDG
jgi:hypothetical protein